MKRTLAILLLLAAPPAYAADIDVLRENFLRFYTAAGASRGSPRMQMSLGELEGAVRSYTAPGYLLSDGSWTDVNYKETPAGSWSPWEHVKRLMLMAKAYQTPGQPLYRDRQLLAQIEASLRKVSDFYGGSTLPLGNWWFWTIGVPLDLGPTLVLMRGEISTKTYDDLSAAIALRIGSSPAARGIVGPTPTGQNLVWSSFTHLCLALIEDDPAMLALVRDAMAGVTLPTSGEGIKSDGSFHQHGAQLYTGGYGGSFANDAAKYALIARNTSYALPPRSLAALSDYVADGIAWSLYGNYFDVSTIGREVARRSTTGFNGIAALLEASQFDSPRAAEIRGAAARMLQSWQWGLPVELAGLAGQVEGAQYAAAAPQGHRHYYLSDYTSHRRAGWYASVKMFSTRTKSGERTNGENLLGSRQSDGRFHLALSGDEHFGRDVWPAFDWTRLPGTTVEQHARTADDTYGYGTRSFAGGTGDGRNGVSAMELAPLNSTLTAKKAWFFFDDSIVFLTNSITSPSANRVETIVTQWPLVSDASQLVSGPGWSVLEGTGYYFSAGGNLQMKREARTGTWASLGGSADTTPYTRTFVTLWLDHGTAPVNAAAEYVVVPNVTPAGMRDWVATSSIAIIANNANVSAVRNRRESSLGIVFWTAGAVEGVQSSAPAILHFAESGRNLVLNATDPTNGVGTYTVTLPGRYEGAGAKAGSRSTTIEIARNGGKTVSVTLTLVESKRRSTRR
ncbi:MAG: hypothetical protein JJE51_12165 [Thermoanaerobaculia bacterium]|nr:hypothetical protein [Thermoanaerobaculia bacterium]